ncbi:hypothetical protein AAFF_G00067420 [Aldrovandia affinis]|uniref:Uncharacterized protein n=1 Tax=Aldrovandia affinis TaxID=143900 RepID=A0AAD7T480_9TELE|nr:hypothetical protein AAFF_G00067420 [Aldrovandia affinis]
MYYITHITIAHPHPDPPICGQQRGRTKNRVRIPSHTAGEPATPPQRRDIESRGSARETKCRFDRHGRERAVLSAAGSSSTNITYSLGPLRRKRCSKASLSGLFMEHGASI